MVPSTQRSLGRIQNQTSLAVRRFILTADEPVARARRNCDVCRSVFSGSETQRYRCTQTHDWDMCQECWVRVGAPSTERAPSGKAEDLAPARHALLRLQLAVATAESIVRGTPPPQAMLPAPGATSSTTAVTWTWGRRHTDSTRLSQGDLVMEKTDSSPDYSIALGSRSFTAGTHSWVLQIDRDTDGVWVGVAAEPRSVNVGSCIASSSQRMKAWCWRPSGNVYCVRAGDASQENHVTGFRCGDKIQFELDLGAGTISFSNLSQGGSAHTLSGLSGEVAPFVCFDYQSKVSIVSQKTTNPWVDAAVGAWQSGTTWTAKHYVPPCDAWCAAHDELLCRALAPLELGAAPEALLQGIERDPRYPQLHACTPDSLLGRATLLSRYSELVVSVTALMGQVGETTQSIRAARGVILPMHKNALVERLLGKIRARAGRDHMPEFKISRAKFLSGQLMAADGSDSISYQIFEALKQAGHAERRDELYRGRELWWKVEFYGEGVQDCGGAFRESVTNIGADLMKGRYREALDPAQGRDNTP